jgi:chemotaxis protein MotB
MILSLSLLQACVPARKFEELKEKMNQCETDRSDCSAQLQAVKTADSLCQLHSKWQEMRIEKSVQDSIEIHTVHLKTKELYNALSDTYERLLKHNQHENDKFNENLRESEQKRNVAQKQLDEKEASLNKLKDELSLLQTNLKLREEKMQQLQSDLQQREYRVNELQTMINAKDSALIALKNHMTQALLGYKDAGIDVTVKNGKVYVSLSEQLLFASGSANIDKKGKEALLNLSSALQQQPDINILVEGHTDDLPISTEKIKDNWDLSVLRANSIVRILSGEGKLDPKRLVSSGRGEFAPLDPSKTAESRRKNRRTEIILSPRMDDLMKLLEK